MDRYVKLNKEYRDLEEIVSVYKEYKSVLDNLLNTRTILKEGVEYNFDITSVAETLRSMVRSYRKARRVCRSY